MKKIPTANKLIRENDTLILHKVEYVSYKETRSLMVEFAKMHVEAALKAALNSAEIISCGNPYDPSDDSKCVDDKSILNSYSLDNIK